MPAFKANAKPTRGGSGEDVATTAAADPPATARAPPARAVSYGPPLPRCRTCSEPTGKLCSRRAARRGAQTGGDADARQAVRHARAQGTARHGAPAARGYASPSAPHSNVAGCGRCFARKKTAGAAPRAAVVSPRWKLNCRLPERGGHGDDEVVRHVVNGLQFQWYGVGQLIAVCFMSTHFF